MADIPVSGLEGADSAMLVCYEEHQFQWMQEKLLLGSIEDVKNGNGVLVVYDQDQKWQVGDTFSFSLSQGEAVVMIAGVLAEASFDRNAGEQAVICSENTFTALTGCTGYSIIDLQADKNAPPELDFQIGMW